MSLCSSPAMQMVCNANPAVGGIDLAGQTIGEVASSAGSSMFNQWMTSMAEAMAEAFGNMVAFMVTWWVDIPTPGMSMHHGPVAELQRHLAYYMFVAATLGLVVAAAKIALEQRGENHATEAGKGLVRWVVLTGAGTAGIALLTQAGDAFSSWIIERSSGADLGKALAPHILLVESIGPLGSTLVIILAAIAILGAFVQALLMFIRSAMLVICAGVLPLAAAAGISGGTGKSTLDKLLAWLIAFILYKPVAAVVYAAAFWTTSSDGGPQAQLSGIFMIILATAALPALMRLITPQVESLTSRGGSSGAGMAAGQAAASGARMMSSSGGGGKTSGGSGGGGGGSAGGGPGLVSPSGASGGGAGGAAAGKGAAAGGSAASAGAGGGTTAGAGGAATGSGAAAGPAGVTVAAGTAAYKGVKGGAQKAADAGASTRNEPPSGAGGAKGGPR